MKIHSLPYGHPLGATLNSLQIPAFFCFFPGCLSDPAVLSPSGSLGLFPFPAALRSGWVAPPNISKGSPRGLGPGRHDMYCHASPHVHERSVDAASSIRNWISYSSHASWLVAFCWRRSTVCKWATISGTISGDRWDSTAVKRVKQRTQVIMSITRLWDRCCCNA